VGVFRLLDLDDNGSLEKQEFKLGMRTFGRFSGSQEVSTPTTRCNAWVSRMLPRSLGDCMLLRSPSLCRAYRRTLSSC
jgi:hypothetical protein